jgi:hypothetical protein
VTAAAVALALTSAVDASDAVTSDEQRALVPAYFYPDHWSTPNPWHSMCDELGQDGPGSIAVMNPYNGPDKTRNPDYQQVLTHCQAAGQKVIGYVHTSYGRRSARAVRADIDAYYRYYPTIDGIFLDEMSNSAATQPYYSGLYRHVKGRSTTRDIVVGNPGAAATTSWQLDTPVADTVVVFEGSASTFATWSPPQWTMAQPASKVAHLVHASPDAASMAAGCARSQQLNGGYAYVTDDQLPNPWDSLPSYWTEAVSSC